MTHTIEIDCAECEDETVTVPADTDPKIVICHECREGAAINAAGG